VELLMANVFQNYTPKTFDDLLFEDDAVRQQLLGYATGVKRSNILLWGQPGSGKSIAASVIANDARLASNHIWDFPASVINGHFWNNNCDSQHQILMGFNTGNPFVIIDEVDELKSDGLAELTAFMDKTKHLGSLILTTNTKPKLLLERLVDRCDVQQIERLSLQKTIQLVSTVFSENGLAHYTPTDIEALARTTLSSGFDTNGSSIKRASFRHIEKMVDEEITNILTH